MSAKQLAGAAAALQPLAEAVRGALAKAHAEIAEIDQAILEKVREASDVASRPYSREASTAIFDTLIDRGAAKHRQDFERLAEKTALVSPPSLLGESMIFPLTLSATDSSLWVAGHARADEPAPAAAINFYFGEQLKAGFKRLLASVPWPADVGLPPAERQARLDAIEGEIVELERRKSELQAAIRGAS